MRSSLSLGLSLDEFQCPLPRHGIDAADAVGEGDSVAFFCHPQHLGAEGGADELRAGGTWICRVCGLLALLPAACVGGTGRAEGGQVFGHGGTILGVEIGIDFVENVEGCWVGGLDGENQGKRTETWKRMC